MFSRTVVLTVSVCLIASSAFVVADDPPRGFDRPLPKGQNRLLLFRNGGLTLIDPDGKNEVKVYEQKPAEENMAVRVPRTARLSPDGKQVAIIMSIRMGVPKPGDPEVRPASKLYVRGLEDKGSGTDLGVDCQAFAWSADGSEIVCGDFIDGTDKKSPEATHFVVNVFSTDPSRGSLTSSCQMPRCIGSRITCDFSKSFIVP